MWKFSLILLSLISIGNSSTQDPPGTTDISRNFRNYENQGYEETRSLENPEDFESKELIGKWRNSGTALEPKWRDGDSLPLVPFDSTPRRKKLTLENADYEKNIDDPEETPRIRIVQKKLEDPEEISKTRILEKQIQDPEYKSRVRILEKGKNIERNSGSSGIEVPIPDVHYSAEDSRKRDAHFGKRDEDSTTRGHVFSRREKYRGPKTRLGSSHMLAESEIEEELFLEMNPRSSYGDTFQNGPNEYELNDEEYQKPRPRKRRPPQNHEFVETRTPTFSVSWSTEKYEETFEGPPAIPRPLRRLETTTRRGEKKKNRQRVRMDQDPRRRKENAELKSFLKMQQVEGLSLSELLQRRNFTLNDLLRGKTEALNVLKSSDSDSSEIVSVKSKIFEPQKLFEVQESQKLISDLVKISNSSSEEVSIPKVENEPKMETSTRKLDIESSEEKSDLDFDVSQRSSNENEKISAIVRLTKPIILPRYDYLTETSTSTSVRVQKLNEDSLKKNDENSGKREKSLKKLEDDEIMEFSDFTMKKIETSSVNPKTTTTRSEIEIHEDLGSTLSIENILSSTQKTGTTEAKNETRPLETKVNTVTDASRSEPGVFRIMDLDYQSDEPRELQRSNRENLDETFDREELTMGDQPYEKIENKEEIVETEPKRRVIFSTSSKPYELVISEIEPEARAEIFELFSSGSSAKRLERLLKSRNMSIDELIELRKRGSSKVHLAEIVRSRDNPRNFGDEMLAKPEMSTEKIPETTVKILETTEKIVQETTTEDLSDIEIDSSSTENEEDQIVEEKTNISFMGEKTRIESPDDDKNEQLLELLKAFDSLPFSVRTENVEDSLSPLETKISSRTKASIVEKSSDHPRTLVEIGVVEEILERESGTEKNTSNYSTGGEKRKNFSKVRPSIIASGAILGVTIVVFLAIFIVCRIRQKQKYTYRNSFSRAVFQSPAMTARKLSNSSSLNTIMVNVVATSTTKRPDRRDTHDIEETFETKSDIENDSLDANDSWDTIPDFMK